MDDNFEELQRLAENVAHSLQDSDPDTNTEPALDTTKRWQHLFGYTYAEAAQRIRTRRTDVARVQVPDSHWLIVHARMEAQGYDREAYEHMLESGAAERKRKGDEKEKMLTPLQARAVYVLKLEGPLSTASEVQMAAKLALVPETLQGSTEEEENARFCQVNGGQKRDIEMWLSRRQNQEKKNLDFKPIFARIKKAYKELDEDSIYPTLGIDSTLPQFRPCQLEKDSIFQRPYETQYPVWYFFYGTLADPEILARVLSLSPSLLQTEPIKFYSAHIQGGAMRTWGRGKYNALVDGSQNQTLFGSAYQVQTQQHEDALRVYETDAYEVVRCLISMDGRAAAGCTFRFLGEVD